MAKRNASNDFMDDLFAAEEKKPRRRRIAATPQAPGGPSGPAMSGGPSGPAMSGGPSGPAMSGGPSGPAMSGGLNAMKSAPAKRRKRISKDDMKQLYG